MKKQLQKMAGREDDWTLELRKFPLTTKVDLPNFESVTFEQLRTFDKPIKLEKITIYHHAVRRLELSFTNGMESAAYQNKSYSKSDTSYEQTWDTEKKIKKISMRADDYVRGMKFLDENDNELFKWD